MNCVLLLLLMCGCDIRAAERSSTKPFNWAGKCVRVSDRQQVLGVPGQRCGPSCPPTPSPSPASTLSLTLPPFLSCTLFPFDHIRAKTCRAIYRRVVLFYQPCVYLWHSEVQRASWLLTSAVQRCREMGGMRKRKGGKERQKRKRPNDKGRDKRMGRTELEDAWHLGVSKAFAWSLSGEVRRFISVCKMWAQNECTQSRLCTCFSLILSPSLSDIIAGCMGKTEWLG